MFLRRLRRVQRTLTSGPRLTDGLAQRSNRLAGMSDGRPGRVVHAAGRSARPPQRSARPPGRSARPPGSANDLPGLRARSSLRLRRPAREVRGAMTGASSSPVLGGEARERDLHETENEPRRSRVVRDPYKDPYPTPRAYTPTKRGNRVRLPGGPLTWATSSTAEHERALNDSYGSPYNDPCPTAGAYMLERQRSSRFDSWILLSWRIRPTVGQALAPANCTDHPQRMRGASRPCVSSETPPSAGRADQRGPLAFRKITRASRGRSRSRARGARRARRARRSRRSRASSAGGARSPRP